MTIENWIMIAVAFATVLAAVGSALGPAIGVIIQARLDKQTNDAQGSVGVVGFFRRIFQFAVDWFPWVLIVICIYSLYQELKSDEPVTRAVVFRISAWVSTITVNITLLIVERSIAKIWDGILSIVNTMNRHVDLTKQHLETTLEVTEMALGKRSEPDKKPRSKSLK